MDAKISQTALWRELTLEFDRISTNRISNFFLQDKERAKKYSCEACDLFLDYSKSFIDDKALQTLFKLPNEVNLSDKIASMFRGDKVNVTENRAVLHTALRNLEPNASLIVDGKDVMEDIRAALDKMEVFSNSVREQNWLGFSGKPIRDVVNIGIGGSDLGPRMVVESLKAYELETINFHFVSNVDATELSEVLKNIDPETTLFIVASKTFTTQETLCNASSVRNWFLEKTEAGQEKLQNHFVAVTAHPERAQKFGIANENVFPFWDFVGGRVSLWSALGLIIAIAIGIDKFKDFLMGAHLMDGHFKNALPEENLPIILALLSIWNRNFHKASTYAVLPYDQYLHLLPSYLQQLEMESNGKSVTLNGEKVDYQTSPILWGASGTNGQHAFHQLLMQGTEMVPVDFILPVESLNPIGEHHKWLMANCLAQSKALMEGRDKETVRAELLEQGLGDEEISKLIPHKLIHGNVPSNTILLPKVTPKTLGSLIALYEHKTFVEGVILNINSFDQWGVELGKKLAKQIVPILKEEVSMDGRTEDHFDGSTKNLLAKIKKFS